MAFVNSQTPNYKSTFDLINFYRALFFQIKALYKYLFQFDNISAARNT